MHLAVPAQPVGQNGAVNSLNCGTGQGGVAVENDAAVELVEQFDPGCGLDH